jgi:hypothetical protein
MTFAVGEMCRGERRRSKPRRSKLLQRYNGASFGTNAIRMLKADMAAALASHRKRLA